jgi:hypothetical protein
MNPNDAGAVRRVYEDACGARRRARVECWQRSLHGKGGEECLREELLEKRCLARHFCPNQADEFYGASRNLVSSVPSSGSGSSNTPAKTSKLRSGDCSLWAEAFAFGPNAVQRSVSADKKKIAKCRKITQRLSKCLAKFSLQSSS